MLNAYLGWIFPAGALATAEQGGGHAAQHSVLNRQPAGQRHGIGYCVDSGRKNLLPTYLPTLYIVKTVLRGQIQRILKDVSHTNRYLGKL